MNKEESHLLIEKQYQKLHKVFGSKIKTDEMLLLLHDQKEVVRQAFYEEEFPKVEKFCQERNIHFCKSKFKVILFDEETGNFSNKGIVVKEDDKRPAAHFYYFSKSEEKSYLANYYELTDNVKEFGLLLGYPRCCVRYFMQNFSANNPNPELSQLNIKVGSGDTDVEKVHPTLNLSKRGNDAVLISHFPCNANCSASIEIAEQNLLFIKQNFRGRAQELVKILNIMD
ncbi:MAG: hypothetical protein ABIG93_04870 [archaeon]|nr:hypothetical protein [Nanoarchaeota archaeon]